MARPMPDARSWVRINETVVALLSCCTLLPSFPVMVGTALSVPPVVYQTARSFAPGDRLCYILLMIPIKDSVPRNRFPFVTVAIISINIFVFLFELSLPGGTLNEFIYLFGLVPARYSHPAWAEIVGYPLGSYWPFLTNLFLHGGWLHIIANMWFLFLFGDNVEDRMGPFRFFLFYIAAGVSANLIYFLVSRDSTTPVIGASGAIAGVMAAYLRLFPQARIITLVPVLFFPFFFEIPALFFMVFWFFLQLISGAATLAVAKSGSGIAWWAHIGGFAVGFFLVRPLCSRSFGGCAPPGGQTSFS
jgi:membrane associated rhomboid family serine protease